ncbi:MAG: sensor histidine kinase, partial [Rhodobacteraceae bacterium]|nr:sensor histidine kinase [Paracoccaceae bacterium]
MSVSPPNIQGSIRQRLLIMLLLSAAGIAILLYVVVQSVAEQIAQESQDNILAASAISILDSARVVEGDISIDLPYSSLSMLDSVTDERAFYAIRLNDEFLSGYP